MLPFHPHGPFSGILMASPPSLSVQIPLPVALSSLIASAVSPNESGLPGLTLALLGSLLSVLCRNPLRVSRQLESGQG